MNDSRARIVLSVLLILMGLAFLAFEVAGWAGITLTWPLGIIAVGGLLFLAMLLGGRGLGVLAIPASIVTTLGGDLLGAGTFQPVSNLGVCLDADYRLRGFGDGDLRLMEQSA